MVAGLALCLLLALTAQTGVVRSLSTLPPGAEATFGPTSAPVCGTLRSEGALAIPTTGTVEEVLRTYTLLGGSMAVNGDRVRARAWFTTVNNANTKTGRIRFGGIGGAIVATGNAAVSQAGSSYLDAEIIRTGPTAQDAYGLAFTNNSASLNFARSAPTQTLSGSVDIVVTGTTPTLAGDMVLQAFVVECGKAP